MPRLRRRSGALQNSRRLVGSSAPCEQCREAARGSLVSRIEAKHGSVLFLRDVQPALSLPHDAEVEMGGRVMGRTGNCLRVEPGGLLQASSRQLLVAEIEPETRGRRIVGEGVGEERGLVAPDAIALDHESAPDAEQCDEQRGYEPGRA